MLSRFFTVLACLLAVVAWPTEQDRAQILDGVKAIAAPGIPGAVSAFGENAFPVVVGSVGKSAQAAVAAASRMGRGRVVALGHDGYFGSEALSTADTGRFVLNAINWLARGKAKPTVGVMNQPNLLAFLKLHDVNVVEVPLDVKPIGLDVLCLVHEDAMPKAAGERVKQWVEKGGGLLGASTGWGWHMVTSKPFPEHPINRIVESSGLIWTDGMLDRTIEEGFDAKAPVAEYVHAGKALEALAGRVDDPKVAGQCVSSALMAGLSLPTNDRLFVPRLRALRKRAAAAEPPSHDDPVSLKDPLRRVAVALDTREASSAAPNKVKASPAPFPGQVPASAPRVTKTLKIDTRKVGWISTGLYAAPGELVTVTVPTELAKASLAVRIGCHTDELWGNDQWFRAPAVTREFPVTSATTQAANAFGGLVYIVVPESKTPAPFEATIAGAIEAPCFVLGKTTDQEWVAKQRSLAGPWAELVTEKIILTVPSKEIRALTEPTALMQVWDKALDACADLACWPRERRKPERIVADEQISLGYMHSGYPIMTWLDAPALAVDRQKLLTEGSWGHFHELGHNHQHEDWTFDGTVEVTENLFSMYEYATVTGRPFNEGHPAIKNRDEFTKRAREHIAKGAPYAKWQDDPFLALTMYIQLIDGFGWDAYKKVFAEYRVLPASERPKNDQEKRDQWMVRFSRAVGRNLGPFFEKWGVPTTPAARQSIAGLPGWMPKEIADL